MHTKVLPSPVVLWNCPLKKKIKKNKKESVPGREIICMFISSAKSDHKKH